MLRIILAFLVLSSLSSVAGAQAARAPYADQEARDIKALSADEIESLMNGRGMGLAKAAELNHFPGPMHALEMASALLLTEKQKAEAQRIFDRMRNEAIRIGTLIVAKERELDALFAENKVDSANLKQLTATLARLQGQLRLAHLEAHLKMKHLLSNEQVARYDELRGYKSGTSSQPHKHGGTQ